MGWGGNYLAPRCRTFFPHATTKSLKGRENTGCLARSFKALAWVVAKPPSEYQIRAERTPSFSAAAEEECSIP